MLRACPRRRDISTISRLPTMRRSHGGQRQIYTIPQLALSAWKVCKLSQGWRLELKLGVSGGYWIRQGTPSASQLSPVLKPKKKRRVPDRILVRAIHRQSQKGHLQEEAFVNPNCVRKVDRYIHNLILTIKSDNI